MGKENSDLSDLEDRLEAFIKGGDCKEAYTVFDNCIEEAEKKKEHPGKCFPRLLRCMEAHPDYYRPFLEARKAGGVEIYKGLESLYNDFESAWGKEGDPDEWYWRFMEGGGCKESSRAWDDCMKEAKKKNGSFAKCYEGFSTFMSCMEARRDYYQPYLEMAENGRQTVIKELEASLPYLKKK